MSSEEQPGGESGKLPKGHVPCAESGCPNSFKLDKGMPSSRPPHIHFGAKNIEDLALSQKDIKSLTPAEQRRRFDVKAWRICVACEKKYRLQEWGAADHPERDFGIDYCEDWKIRKDMRVANRQSTWGYWVSSQQETKKRLQELKKDDKDLTPEQLRARKSKVAKQVSKELAQQ